MIRWLLKMILVIVMSVCNLGLFSSYFIEQMYTPEHLIKAIEDIDLIPLIQENISGDYKKVLEVLIETDEFQLIVEDYTNAFMTFLCDNKTTYTITDETEAVLFRLYSTSFLEKYPQLSFLPNELFIDFLVERIDLNGYLPSFQELRQKIPSEFFLYKDYLVSSQFRTMCFVSLIISFILFNLVSKKVSYYGLGISYLAVSLIMILFMTKQWLIYLPTDYLWLTSCLEYFTSQLNDVFKSCIIGAMGCFLIEWGRFYAKKIFLL